MATSRRYEESSKDFEKRAADERDRERRREDRRWKQENERLWREQNQRNARRPSIPRSVYEELEKARAYVPRPPSPEDLRREEERLDDLRRRTSRYAQEAWGQYREDVGWMKTFSYRMGVCFDVWRRANDTGCDKKTEEQCQKIREAVDEGIGQINAALREAGKKPLESKIAAALGLIGTIVSIGAAWSWWSVSSDVAVVSACAYLAFAVYKLRSLPEQVRQASARPEERRLRQLAWHESNGWGYRPEEHKRRLGERKTDCDCEDCSVKGEAVYGCECRLCVATRADTDISEVLPLVTTVTLFVLWMAFRFPLLGGWILLGVVCLPFVLIFCVFTLL